MWFVKDPETDAAITQQFRDTHAALAQTPDMWSESPLGALAAIIALDQFSRNMFRGSKQSFAYDELAIGVASRLIAGGREKLGSEAGFGPYERMFAYMPFMHSEKLEEYV